MAQECIEENSLCPAFKGNIPPKESILNMSLIAV